MRVGVRVPLLVAAAAACVLAPLLMAVGAHSPLRVLAAVGLFALAPGAAIVGSLVPRTSGFELALVVGVSLGVSTVVAELMLAFHIWSPLAGTWVLAAACLPPIAI